MELTIVFMIKDGRKQEVEVKAYSKESATVFIKADNLEEAKSLFPEAEAQANHALNNFIPAEQSRTEQPAPKSYRTINTPLEDIQADINSFTGSAAGHKYIGSLENAKQFCYKHNSSMSHSELSYFINLAMLGCEWEAINGAYHMAYRKGYNAGAAEQKRKGKQC